MPKTSFCSLHQGKNKKIFEAAKIIVLDPILEEQVKAEHHNLVEHPFGIPKDYWERDKKMIREANVIVDTTPEDKSEGVAHEIGYARYSLWKPVVRMYKEGSKPTSLIAVFEDDLIVHSPQEAAIQIQKYWGTRLKRFLWRIGLLNRCLIKWIYYQPWWHNCNRHLVSKNERLLDDSSTLCTSTYYAEYDECQICHRKYYTYFSIPYLST